jgi:CheY-like chemotaxis protein/HPt (histidine-containing phosphotransfer) domain-containing protein
VTSGEADKRIDGARILLVEDNEINQQIAIELLEAAGAAVTVAGNGREAVQILTGGPHSPPFDVVLMDLQMPEMDGYQATAKLRSDPRFARLPIVAMTAHATIEETQRCLAAGMNDHVAKPIDPRILLETVARFNKAPAQATAASTASGAAARRSTPDDVLTLTEVDTKAGLSRVGGNRDLYVKLLRRFVDEQERSADQIAEALNRGDAATAERLAHSVKGASGNLGATRVHAAAGAVEKLLRQRTPSNDVEPALQHFAAAFASLVAELRTVLVPTAAASPPPIAAAQPAPSRQVAAQLRTLLADLDPGAADFIETNHDALRPLFAGGTWPEFEKLVRDYAFADAREQLEQALEAFR